MCYDSILHVEGANRHCESGSFTISLFKASVPWASARRMRQVDADLAVLSERGNPHQVVMLILGKLYNSLILNFLI